MKTHISMFLSLSIVCVVNSLQKFEEKIFRYYIVQLVYRIMYETCFLIQYRAFQNVCAVDFMKFREVMTS